jgi:hypothetical protein
MKSIPATPIHIPTLNLPNEWDGYFRPKTYAEVASSSTVKLDDIKVAESAHEIIIFTDET